MRFPWANSVLLTLLGAELVTGFFGLVSGSADRAIFMQAHRAAGYGIILVLLWKAGNIMFSLRWRRAAAPRTASLALLLLLAVSLGLGFAWSLLGSYYFCLVQRRELAHLRGRGHLPGSGVALAVPHASLSLKVLG